MAIKKSFENQFGVEVSYHKIIQLTPIKAGEFSMMGNADSDKERVLVLLAGYLNQEAKDAGKAVMENRSITLVGSVDEGRTAIYEKIMELPEWKGSESC